MAIQTKTKKEKAMRKSFQEEIEIPAGIEASIHGNVITMKKDSKELKRNFNEAVTAVKQDNKIIVSVKNARKEAKRLFGSAKSHIRNMIAGLEQPYEYELEVCNVHFPITVTFDKAKSEFIVKNMLGEKCPRIIKVSKNVEVEVKMPIVKIKSFSLEDAGQAAANLEKVSRVRNRDRNKFQDGVFITKKPGRSFL
jgi:large subunit ribosomal protein L6